MILFYFKKNLDFLVYYEKNLYCYFVVFFNNVYLFNYFKSIYVILSIGKLRINCLFC